MLLGDSFDVLHPHVRRAHEAPLSAVGTAEVLRAGNPVGALVARMMNFPPPGSGVPVQLDVRETPRGTVWSRRFGGRRVQTVQKAIDGRMVEHRGPGRLSFAVSLKDGAVTYESEQFAVFGLSFPKSMAPRATGKVTPTEDGWQVQIEVAVPLVGRLCAYTARMRCAT